MIETRVEQSQEAMQSSSTSALVAVWHKSSRSGTNKKSDNTQSQTKKKKDYSQQKCYSCGKIDHIQFRCPKKKEDYELAESNWNVKKNAALLGVALMTGAVDSDAWITDSGATHHMTKSQKFFTSCTVFDEPKPVVNENQKVMQVYGYGDIRIGAQVDGAELIHVMKDVWYTPEVVKNLFFIPSAADKGFEYWLDNKQCRIIRDSETFFVGERY